MASSKKKLFNKSLTNKYRACFTSNNDGDSSNKSDVS